MEVYAHRSFCLQLPEFLRRFHNRVAALPVSPAYDAVVELFVDAGEVHAALADAVAPGDPTLDAWSQTMQALAAALRELWRGRSVQLRIPALPSSGPGEVRTRTPEGFAHFALLPEQYLLAAERLVRQRSPVSLLCVGVRSIGSPLAFLVAAAASALNVPSKVVTVRPRGHPFDRRLDHHDAAQLVANAPHFSDLAIVDEGPRLSGSSFAAASDALAGAGVAPDRIVLFPSWNATSDAIRSERGRAAWLRHERAVAAFEDVWSVDGYLNVSAGRWRRCVFGTDEVMWPAAHPQHERRKYFADPQQRAGPEHQVLRFAGLGRYGSAKLDRARMLAAAGFAPAPRCLERGFLTEAWVEGRRLTERDGSRPEVLERIAAYSALLFRHCQTGGRARTEDLADGLDRPAPHGFDEPEVAVDGRLLPHEWTETGAALIKVDALDHHADDFLPGCRDIARHRDVARAAR